MRRTARIEFLFPLSLLLATACVQGFDTPSAYEDQRFLCAPENAATWTELSDACESEYRANKGCAGIASFTGQLEGKPVTVEARIEQTTFTMLADAATGDRFLDRVETDGKSPYFAFRLQWKSLGGNVGAPITTERLLRFAGDAETRPQGWLDDVAKLQLRLTAGGASVSLPATESNDSPLLVTYQAADEITGRFAADFGGGDHLDGCFRVFALETRTSEISP